MSELYIEVLRHYDFEAEISDIKRYGSGHINDTFKVSAGDKDYILQRINAYVFKEPQLIMDNVIQLTEFLKKKILDNGGNPDRETLTFLPNKEGNYGTLDSDGGYWRLMLFITDTTGYETADSAEKLKLLGYAFGNFQKMLSDYPVESLKEVIPDFHNTPVRVEQLKEAIRLDLAGRVNSVAQEISFALAREKDASEITDMLSSGRIPHKVTHNDTKMSNILLDNKTGEPVCVIDLDTIMPGAAAYDFGDSIRAGASEAPEDEADLTKVYFSIERFKAYTEGFLNACGDKLSQNELYSLSVGAKLMTYECGIRFLADYLNGDKYYKIAYPEHNLVRARNQFKLVKDMEHYMNEMHAVVKAAADRR